MNVPPNMPDFARGTHAFHHTVDSALSALCGLKVPPARISLRMDGLGYPSRWIVSQSPAPGTPLTPDVNIVLTIAGTGMFQALPVAMWDKGQEAEPGTQEIIELFDDPFQKLAHWVREGARLFDIRPDNLPACARWIALFGQNPEHWPEDMWYRLSILLPNLQALAGKEYGIAFALRLLLDLPLLEIRRSAHWRYMEDEDLSLLSADFNRLGLDYVLGDRLEDLPKLVLVLGQAPLEQYRRFQQEDGRALLDSVLKLVMLLHQKYVVQWILLDSSRKPRLGDESHNALLGLNSHLGPAPATRIVRAHRRGGEHALREAYQ